MATKTVVTNRTTPTVNKAVGTTTKPAVTPVNSKPNTEQSNWFTQYGNNRLEGKGQTAERDAYYNSLANKYGLKQVNATQKPQSGFDQQGYLKGMEDKVNAMYDAQKQSQLQGFYNQRDRAVGQINQQKAELTPMYADKRNQSDVVSMQNIQALKEQMAANGLQASGENVTATVGANNARLSSIANLNLQEQQEKNDLDRRISDLMDPGEEQAIISGIEAQRMQALYDSSIRADEVGYNRGRDAIMDSRYADELKYNRGRDSIMDSRYADETKYNRGIDTRNYNRSVFESDRGYNRSVLESDRSWNKMSPAEKQSMALQYYYSQKGKKGSGGGGGGRSSSSYSGGVTEKNPQLQIDPNKLYAIYDTLGKITPTYGSKGYFDKMNKLQY